MPAPAESRGAAPGSARVVLGTSSQAAELVGRYRRRGCAPIGTWQWDVTDHDGVVIVKNLPPTTP
ncbi:hypothetical protein GCM10010275_40460 [Streptomyces litmocidini]|uniref:hypothetical protein n=1 Tax=Streptomyces litmocidini TaxID=67318 RepID=UPI00167CF8E1|nr:hypothetical protein [Streptomyces litmocidini]GGU97816.1 hypothetical protein GCM10010275_40460 [Streptomyces litmocidini]